MQLPLKLTQLVEIPDVRDIVISGTYCAIDRGRGLAKMPEKLRWLMAQVWILVVLSVRLSALGLATKTFTLRSLPARRRGPGVRPRREFGKETGDS